jgi:hypothetical protein
MLLGELLQSPPGEELVDSRQNARAFEGALRQTVKPSMRHAPTRDTRALPRAKAR